MHKKNVKIGLGAIIVFVMILFSSFQTVAIASKEKEEMVEISIYNYETDAIRTQNIEFDKFITIFEPMNAEEMNSYQNAMQLKIQQIIDLGLMTETEREYLNQQIQSLSLYNSISDVQPTGLFFDLLNIFNGFGFALKGEKTRSFLDLPIMKFPFLNTNITALFSGFNAFEGNGFIFTLGTNGFRYIYDYDRDEYMFPYFSPVKGWFIGYTGFLLEASVSDIFGEEYEGTYIVGIGMNVMTLWNN